MIYQILIFCFILRCEYSTICAPYPKFKKITQNDQIKIFGKCSGCLDSKLTSYSYKIYKNERSDYDLNNVVWLEFPIIDTFFMGNNA